MPRTKRSPKPAEDFRAELQEILDDDTIRPSLEFLYGATRRHSDRPVERSRPQPWSSNPELEEPPDNLSGRSPLHAVPHPIDGNGLAPHPPDNLSGPLYETIDGAIVDMKCIRPYDNVQSAHTPSEHLVYTTMWKMLGSRDDDSPNREGILPMGLVASKVSISLRNLRRVLRSLEQKLALEITEYEDKARAIPRRYRIWGFRPTMERRKLAGYHYVYRNRNLITLARGYLQPPDNLTGGAPDNLTGVPPDNLTPIPPDNLTALLNKKELNNTKTTTTTDVRARLQADLPTFDDDAVEKLWTACRAEVPDVTAEEVHALFRVKLPESRSRLIESPNGFLLRAVARSCTVAAVSAMRRQGREAPADVGPRLEEAELRDLLGDPNTPLELRQQITQKLKNA